MRIRTLTLTLVAVVLALAAPAFAEKSGGDARGTFVIHKDGSVEVDGKYYGDMQEFQLSDEFQKGGHRCASPSADELVELVVGLSPTDCSISSTTIQSEYDPANGPIYTIPVVFHVIQRTDGTGNISNALINSQVDILNEDFRALPGSLGAPGFDTEIQFVLASEDPDGNATTGINRVTSNAYFTDPGPGAFNDMKQALNWDTDRYLNIYTNDAAGNLGYATFPQQDAGAYLDGVVLLYSSVGRNSPGGGIYNLGRTGTHEVGHYLGLFHTFQDGCGSAGAPYTTGDRIADTPRQSAANFNCPAGATSCSSADPIENYMNYTQDSCMDRFTEEQANRMRCAIANYRTTLVGGGGPGPGPGPGELEDGVPVTGLSASTGSETFYTLDVPSGASNLVFQISGGTGDADLYVRQGSPPSQSTWTCRPYLGGNNETCTFPSPAAGTWHVMLHAWSAYSGVTLVGGYDVGSPAPCTGCDHYTGTLSGNGDSDVHPNGTYYQSVAGTHRGWLEGPAGTDFDLELYRWSGSTWTKVAQSISSTSSESITYNGSSGYYYWRILSYSGSGAYDFWLDRP